MLEVIKFEFKYRLGRPATYIYFALLFLIAFLAVTTDIVQAGGSGGKLMENAPTVIMTIMLFTMFLGTFIASAIMGVPVLRDFEHSTASMIFTTPLKKNQYLAGRFIGSFLILVIITSGILWGMMAGHAIPWPWMDQEKLQAFNAYHYFQPFMLFALPNLFFFSAIFFAGGTLGKRMVVVYAQAVILFMGYLIASSFLAELDNRNMGAVLDPFGFGANVVMTQYWTVTEQNSNVIPLEGVVLYNRLVWVGVGIFALVLTFFKFSYNMAGKARKGKKELKETKELTGSSFDIPKADLNYGLSASFIQIRKLSWFYFQWIAKQIPFRFIVLAGVIFIFIVAFVSNSGGYDISTYSTTSNMLQIIGAFQVFFIILIVFYSGELIWKERDTKINLIYDALPYRDIVGLTGKYFGFVMVHMVLLAVLMLCGVIIQLIQGYPVIELGLYFKKLFSDTLLLMGLYTFLGFFIQVIVNQKFLGFALMILFYISFIILDELGVEHNMFYFASANLGQYSEMNSFGHYVTPFSWFNIYWIGLSMFFFGISIMFSVRGTDAILKSRLRVGKMRMGRSLLIFLFGSITLFLFSGAYIYYNTNVKNQYRNSEDQNVIQANYEKELKKYEFMNQPKITETNVTVDIFPKDRNFTAAGSYTLRNKKAEPITEIFIQDGGDSDFKTTLDFGDAAVVKERMDDFGYTIFTLKNSLDSGAEVTMNFKVDFVTQGFKESGSNTRVVYNGTFFDNSYFPSIGYNSGFELGDDDDRKDNGLEEKERMMERDDPRGLSQSLFGDDADKIKFEIVVSTDSSQIAIAPGYLEKKWYDGNRVFYHYKMDVPMVSFYSIVSADYEVMTDVWEAPSDTLDDVSLEIYYHKGHEYNLDRMMRGLKKSLDYYTANFSPYQFRQMRIMEFPRYSSFAQSFANTVPFSEAIGFVQKIEEDDVDLPFYVTAHEVAHQWWGHQVTEAGVKGNAMLSETMSQYSALMVMKQESSEEVIQKYLKHELNSYLFGRTFERKKEMTLDQVEGQGYIHYRKGSLIMYALQDYITEDSVNMALKRFRRDWGFVEGRYPTSTDLIGYFREVTPDTLQYIIDDMFENITLFENKTTDASYVLNADSTYTINLEVDAIKYRADSLGTETAIAMRDYIDIGVYGKDEDGEDKLLYLEKHLIDDQVKSFKITVNEKPLKAGIDPIYKLIDRNPDDNVMDVTEEETTDD